MGEDKKVEGSHASHNHDQQQQQSPPQYYGTFQGVVNHPPPPSAVGFPQPVPPPGVSGGVPSQYYPHAYQTVPGYAVRDGRPVRERRLPCCGIGLGWFLFIIGFFIAGIPWYVAAILLFFSRIDYREKPAYVACTIAAALLTIAAIFGLTRID